ncbi:zeta toxin family protein [Promicromonospora sp. NPDC060204]|uniref:zeta toxin family protein n=1 Tax=Promicromonospora sp. NPDC060204 TaxID=3347071 RepID=UPI0036550FE7
MGEPRDEVHAAALTVISGEMPLDAVLTSAGRRRLVRDARDWYLDAHAGNVTRGGTCVVVTAGPPGAGKSSTLSAAVEDVRSRLVIDADVAKEFIARWCVVDGVYDVALSQVLPDGRDVMPLDLSPLLQTLSTEVCNAVRRNALESGLDIVVESTMSTPAYAERLLLSLAKADCRRLSIVSVETDRDTAHERARARWWAGRLDDHELGGRLVSPGAIDAAFGSGEVSSCRANARELVRIIRRGDSTLDAVTLMEYDDGILTAVDADPPTSVDRAASII